jgi:hypothetical protein
LREPKESLGESLEESLKRALSEPYESFKGVPEAAEAILSVAAEERELVILQELRLAGACIRQHTSAYA